MRVFVLLLIAWTATVQSVNVANEIREMIADDASEEEVHSRRLGWLKEKARVAEDSCSISITASRNAYALRNPKIAYSVDCGGEVVEGEDGLNSLKPIHIKKGIHLFTKTPSGASTYLLIDSDAVDYKKIELLNLPAFGTEYAAPLVVHDGSFTVNDCTFQNNRDGIEAGAILVDGTAKIDLKKGDFFANRGTVGAIKIKDSAHVDLDTVLMERNKGSIVGAILIEDDGILTGEHVMCADNIAEADEEDMEAQSGGILLTGDAQGLFDGFVFGGEAIDQDKRLHLLDESIAEDTIISSTLPHASALKLDENAGLIISRCSFENSTAKYGAVMTSGRSVLTLKLSTFTNNAALRGGGLYVQGRRGSFAKTRRTTFTSNVARYGGAMVVAGNGTFAIDTCNFTSNEAVKGGAIWGDYSNTEGGSCKRAAQGSRVDIQTSKFTRNKASKSGGAFYIACTDINSNFSSFTENEADGNGGAMYAEDTYDLNFVDCNFENNKAGDSGGSLFIKTSHDILNERCTFVDNIAANNGGAISSIDGNGISVKDCSIIDNIAAGKNGGAIHSNGVVNIEVSDSDLRRNTAGESGGALSLHDLYYLRVEQVNVSGNVAPKSGGAVHISKGREAMISNMSITDMSTGHGAISMTEMGTVYVFDMDFTNNSATVKCGALEIDGADSAELRGLLFQSNRAGNFGGSLCLSHAKEATINDTEFSFNEAKQGGAMYMDGGTNVHIIDTDFSQNFGWHKGGAIRGDQVWNLLLDDTRFDTNRAKLSGSAVHMEKSSLNIQKSRFSDNFVGLKAIPISPEDVQKTLTVPTTVISPESTAEGEKAKSEEAVKEPSAEDNSIATVSGGTVSMSDGDSFTSTDNVYFKNSAERIGGMLVLENMKTVFIQAENGGALVLEGTSVAKGGYNKFVNNTAVSGGAFLCKGNSKVNMKATNFSYNSAPEGATVAVSCTCNVDFSSSAFYREKELRGNGDFFHIDKGCGSVNSNGCRFYGKMDKNNVLTIWHWIGIFVVSILIFVIIFAVIRRRRKKDTDLESQKPLLGHRIEIEVSEETSSEYETDSDESSEYDRTNKKPPMKPPMKPTKAKPPPRKHVTTEEESTEESLLETEESETEDEQIVKQTRQSHVPEEEEPNNPIGVRSAKESRAVARRRHASTVNVNDGAGPSCEIEEEVLPPELPPKLSLSLSMDQEPMFPPSMAPKIPEEKQEEQAKEQSIPEEAMASEDADDPNSPQKQPPKSK